jgi:lipooligosaccharide transport system permease protein
MMDGTTTIPAGLRWDAVRAVVMREWWCFRRVWFAPTFGSVFEPLLYLVGFGYGFGALVATVAGVPYLAWMATGAAAVSVLFTASFAGLFNSFFRRTAMHLYDGLLSTPTSVAELITGEATWTGVRCAGVATITLVVAVPLGVEVSVFAAAVPLIGWVGGFAFACFFTALSTRVDTHEQFPFIIQGVFLPVFLVSWAFMPLDQAPVWLRVPSQVNPLTHLLVLLRGAALGIGTAGELVVSAAVMTAFGVGSWLLAGRWLRRAMTT